MNARTTFAPMRGPSMDAMHACPNSIENGCNGDCKQGRACTCALETRHVYPQPATRRPSNFWRVPIQMDFGKKRRGFFSKLWAALLSLIEFAAASVFVALAISGFAVLMGWL